MIAADLTRSERPRDDPDVAFARMGGVRRAVTLCVVGVLLWSCSGADQDVGVKARRIDVTAPQSSSATSAATPTTAADETADTTAASGTKTARAASGTEPATGSSSDAAPATSSPALPLAPIAGVTWQFPLTVSDDHRTLVDVNGRPFRVNGDTGWEAAMELTLDEWIAYLDDRRAKGFNTILATMTSPVASYPESQAPEARGAGGALPFLRNAAGGPWDGDPTFAKDLGAHNPAPGNFDADFSTPNPVYWDFVEQMVAAANERNMLLVLTAHYLGYNEGSQDGWWRTLNNTVNTREVSFGFGEYLGNRFKDYPNIIWQMGVDMLPPAGSEGEARASRDPQGREGGRRHPPLDRPLGPRRARNRLAGICAVHRRGGRVHPRSVPEARAHVRPLETGVRASTGAAGDHA